VLKLQGLNRTPIGADWAEIQLLLVTHRLIGEDKDSVAVKAASIGELRRFRAGHARASGCQAL
jgi:hypothetical protein